MKNYLRSPKIYQKRSKSLSIERPSRGASLVENAILLPIFLLLVLGFLQLSIWGFGIGVVHLAGREACRKGAIWYQQKAWWGERAAAQRRAVYETNKWRQLTSFTNQAMFKTSIKEVGISKGVEGTREFSVHIFMPMPSVVPFFGSRYYTTTVTCRLENYHP